MKTVLTRPLFGSSVLVGFLTVSAADAATLSLVPMQGGMVMPMISYAAAEGRVRVMLDPTVPQLTPLMVSHPGDGFAVEDPWFDLLDPSRQGMAFSRRYGFVMATDTDPLPEGTSLWLRKVSGPSELGAYRYSASAPKAFEPIFGTAGSPEVLRWNGMMFHPTFTAPAGTNAYSATFDVYLGDATTGAERAGSSTGPFVLNWTSVGDERPALLIGQRVVLQWPLEAAGYVLESSEVPSGGIWTAVATAPVTIEGQATVLVEPMASARVYRLRRTP